MSKQNQNQAVMRHTPKGMMNNTNGDILSVFIVGDIGEWATFSWNDLYNELHGKDLNTINVYLSTDGGSIIEAYKIYDSLVGHKATVNMHLFGVVASAGTIIASAGDRVIMSRQSLYMIHRAYFEYVSGNSNSLRRQADVLESQERRAVEIYSERTGLSESDLLLMMDDESWIEPDDALRLGFVDEVVDALEVDFKTAYKPSRGYYDDWWDDYWFKLKDDKTGQSAYQTAALNFLQKGLKPYKAESKMAKENSLIDKFFNLLVGKNLITKDKKEEFTNALNENVETVTGVQTDVLNKLVSESVSKAVNKIEKPKNQVSLDEFKKAFDDADDETKTEIREMFAAPVDETASEGGNAGDETETDEAAKTDDADVQNKLVEMQNQIATLMKTSGKKAATNGKQSTAKNAAKEKKAVNKDKKRTALNLYKNGTLSPEQYEKITGEKPPEL